MRRQICEPLPRLRGVPWAAVARRLVLGADSAVNRDDTLFAQGSSPSEPRPPLIPEGARVDGDAENSTPPEPLRVGLPGDTFRVDCERPDRIGATGGGVAVDGVFRAALADGGDRISRSWLKRLIDVVGALAGIFLLSPLLVATALAIMVESPGSPLFRQRRTGHNGKPFVIYKFRTMRVSEDGADVVQVRREDSRITGVGLFLRRTSIDELPQLINVLRGEMSLVGPRPHAIIHDDYYGACLDTYKERFRTKPGLTGLAQVEGLRGPTPDVATMAARVEKDLEYIREWSVLLDLQIIIRTMLIVAFHAEAF